MTDLAPGTRMAEWLEQAWLDRYLARQLKQEESDWFEAYALDKAELLVQVEDDTDLRDALFARNDAQVAPPGAIAVPGSIEALSSDDAAEPNGARDNAARPRTGAHEPRQGRHAPSAIPTRGSTSRVPPLAMAAGLLLALTLGWFGHGRLVNTSPALAIEPSPTRVVYGAMRGSAAPSQIENPESKSRLILVEVSVPYGAEHPGLEIADIPRIDLAVSSDGLVTFSLPREVAAKTDHAAITYRLRGNTGMIDLAPSKWTH